MVFLFGKKPYFKEEEVGELAKPEPPFFKETEVGDLKKKKGFLGKLFGK